ncbi:MAG: WG repeat-containing protein [Gillisia sp.]
MKRILQFAAFTIAASILTSCGGGGDSISEVKLMPLKSGEDFQYIDQDGKIVINPQFKNATIFRDGLALVQTSGDDPKWGYITEDGKYVINAQYDEATVFSEGLAWVVTENAAPGAIDKKGEVKFTMQDAEKVRYFKNGLAAFSLLNDEGEEKWGFVNKEGKVTINPQFSAVSNFNDGRCGVKNSDGKWGFIDNEGKIIINYQFDDAGDFNQGKCIVETGNKKGVIDKDGKYIINPQFSNMIIDGDIFLVSQDGKWGWCDKEGKLIINPQFVDAYPFNGNKITAVQSGKSFGYIDRDGKFIINPQFDMALPFNGKLAAVVSGSQIGFIGQDGKYAINPQFDGISQDLFTHYLTGNSEFNSVNTDYFNVGAITNLLNFDSPEGFTLSSTFEDVMNKYGLSKNKFNKYSTESEVLSKKKISNDASYDFYVLGSAYDNVNVTKQGYYGAYTSKELQFNGKNKPVSYAYLITLSNKGKGKGKSVIEAIQGKLIGYKKDNEKSTDDTYYYNDGTKEIRLSENEQNVVVVLSNLISKKENEEYEDYAEYEEYEGDDSYYN